MSEWKNARAEAAMREFDKENMAKAAEKNKEQVITGEWKINVSVSGENSKELINDFVTKLMELGQGGTNVIVDIEPIIKHEN